MGFFKNNTSITGLGYILMKSVALVSSIPTLEQMGVVWVLTLVMDTVSTVVVPLVGVSG